MKYLRTIFCSIKLLPKNFFLFFFLFLGYPSLIMVKGVNCFLIEAILLSVQNMILILRVATLVISLAQRSLLFSWIVYIYSVLYLNGIEFSLLMQFCSDSSRRWISSCWTTVSYQFFLWQIVQIGASLIPHPFASKGRSNCQCIFDLAMDVDTGFRNTHLMTILLLFSIRYSLWDTPLVTHPIFLKVLKQIILLELYGLIYSLSIIHFHGELLVTAE